MLVCGMMIIGVMGVIVPVNDAKELYDLIDSGRGVAVLFDEERDCIHCDKMKKYFMAASDGLSDIDSVLVDIRSNPAILDALKWINQMDLAKNLPALVYFYSPATYVVFKSKDSNKQPQDITQEEIVSWLEEVSNIVPVNVEFQKPLGKGKRSLPKDVFPEMQNQGFVGPNSLGSILLLGAATSTCVAFIIWFMVHQLNEPSYRAHTD